MTEVAYKILNLTRFPATREQREAGVIDIDDRYPDVKTLLYFEEIPTKEELEEITDKIADIALDAADYYATINDFVVMGAMIDTASFAIYYLHCKLEDAGFNIVYPFYTLRNPDKINDIGVCDEIQPDGAIRMPKLFIHKGFVEL